MWAHYHVVTWELEGPIYLHYSPVMNFAYSWITYVCFWCFTPLFSSCSLNIIFFKKHFYFMYFTYVFTDWKLLLSFQYIYV